MKSIRPASMAAILLSAALLVLLASLQAPAGSFGRNEPPPYSEGEIVVKFRPGTTEERAAEIIEEKGAAVIRTIGRDIYLVRVSGAVEGAAAVFSAVEEVEFAEPNYEVSK